MQSDRSRERQSTARVAEEAAGPSTDYRSLQAAAEPCPPAPNTPQQLDVPAGLRLARRVETALIIWSLLIQARFYTHRGPQLTAAQHAQQAVLLSVRTFFLLLALTMPHRAWLRHRAWMIFAARVWMARLSSIGSQEGHAVLLQRGASPGLLGCILDILRVGNGTRLLPSALTAALLHLPPLSVLIQQLLTLGLSQPRGFCASPLLGHALTQQRTAVAWGVLELTPFTVIPPSSAPKADLPGAQQAGQQCMAVLTWAQLMIGVALPTLVAGCTARLVRLPPSPSQQGQQGQRSAGVGAAARSAVRKVGAAVGWLWSSMDGLVAKAACILASDPFYLLSGMWVLGGLCWLLAKAQAKAALAAVAPASLLVLPAAAATLAVRRSCYHGAALEALLLRWDPSSALFDTRGAVALSLDASEAAAGRQDLFGRPHGAQSRRLLRLVAAVPMFDVGAMYVGLLNEAALAALLDNRSRAEWRAAAAALAAAATADDGNSSHGSSSSSGSSSSGETEAEASCMRTSTFSVRHQLSSLGMFASMEAYPGSTAGLQSALAAAVQTVALF